MLENNDSTTVFETTTLFLNYNSTNWEKPTYSNSSIKALEGALIGFLKDLPIPLAAVITIAIIVIVVICIVCVCICRRCRKKKAKAAKANGTYGASQSQISGLTYTDKVQPELFSHFDDGFTESMYSEARQGKLEISLDFDFSKNELQVGVLQAVDLPAADADGFSDPYVKVYFSSNKKFKFETKVLKKTLNPVYNEHFIFKVPYSELVNDMLIFAVYDFNRIMKHTLMGLVKVPMKSLNLSRVYTDFRDITSPELEHESEEGQLGDVCFSLRYVPITGKLTVVILEAKCLRKMDNVGLSDPYVKVSMYIGKKLVKKKKTSIKRKTVTPYYNEQFTFDVLPKDIDNVTMHITVVDYDRIGRSEPIGHVVLGKEAEATQRRHWDDMIKFPRRPIAQWHSLTEIPK